MCLLFIVFFNRRLMMAFIATYFKLELSTKTFRAMEKNYHVSSYIRRPLLSAYFQEENLPDNIRDNPEEDVIDPFDDNADEDLAQKMDGLAVDPYVSPLFAENLTNLPPAYMLVAEFDPLRDDGLLYTDRLKKAGVKVNLSYCKGHPHGFMAPKHSILSFQGADKEWEKIYTYLKENL